MAEPHVTIYTDGACSGNPGPGGWGAILISGSHQKELKGGEPVTTNNRMELMAAISALEALKRPAIVDIHTDSQCLDAALAQHRVRWHWVRGHAGHDLNERADRLAREAIAAVRAGAAGALAPRRS